MISAFLGTAILTIFAVALAESISAGFAGFWGGLPFWIIILFVLGLAVYNFLEDCFTLGPNLKFLFHAGAILYAGIALAFGSWQASKYVTKYDVVNFRLPFFDTTHLLSAGWLQAIWIMLCLVFILITAIMVTRRYGEYTSRDA